MSQLRYAIPAISLIMLSGCVNRYQVRADVLDQSIRKLAVSRNASKDDFVRYFGVPSACTQLASGESCEWRNDTKQVGDVHSMSNHNYYSEKDYGKSMAHAAARVTETMKVEFSLSGQFIRGGAIVQRGRRTYTGGQAQARP